MAVVIVLLLSQNWETLRDGPAPYKPDRADEMSALLERVKHISASDPEMPNLVKRITSNFDDFQEVICSDESTETRWRGQASGVEKAVCARMPPVRRRGTKQALIYVIVKTGARTRRGTGISSIGEGAIRRGSPRGSCKTLWCNDIFLLLWLSLASVRSDCGGCVGGGWTESTTASYGEDHKLSYSLSLMLSSSILQLGRIPCTFPVVTISRPPILGGLPPPPPSPPYVICHYSRTTRREPRNLTAQAQRATRTHPTKTTWYTQQEDATRFGGHKKVVRRGDKDNHFVGYTYKRKPNANRDARPSVPAAAAAAAAPEGEGSGTGPVGGGGPRVDTTVGGGAGSGGAAAPDAGSTESGKSSPTSGKSSPSSEFSSSPSGSGGGAAAGTRKSVKKSGFGLFSGRKGP